MCVQAGQAANWSVDGPELVRVRPLSPSLNHQLDDRLAILVHDTMDNQRYVTSVWQHR